MFASSAAPPNSAAAPTAAVCTGTPAVWGRVEVAFPEPVGERPEGKGSAEPLEAPLKAGGELDAVALGVAVLLSGLRTLFQGGRVG